MSFYYSLTKFSLWFKVNLYVVRHANKYLPVSISGFAFTHALIRCISLSCKQIVNFCRFPLGFCFWHTQDILCIYLCIKTVYVGVGSFEMLRFNDKAEMVRMQFYSNFVFHI